jgi:4-amino-4-deoxy-L-arabinose transferase-like glycosyltransferase
MLFPALLINLGLNPHCIANDEGTRVLVAQEMIMSGNYINPTIYGEAYLKKPPLFNWIIITFWEIAGADNELISRLPSVVGLIFFGITIFLFTRNYYNTRFAFLNAMIYVVNGRILFWDSFLGLIDITFSWIIYMNFMIIYHLYVKRKFLLLFLISYFLLAVGYMLKGLPALVFQAITLLTLFTYKRDFKRLFFYYHYLGILLFLLIAGGYYFLYFQHSQVSVESVFNTLFTETTRRTGIRLGLWQTILHFFSFPFEVLYHFAPFTILVVFLFRKGIFRDIFRNDFLKYNALVFFFNIIIYWTSPEVFPRYLLMLIPLLYIILLHFFFYDKSKYFLKKRAIVEYVLLGFMLLGAIGAFILPFRDEFDHLSNALLKGLFISATLLFLASIYWKIKESRLVIIVIALLIVRIGFNWFILPDRAAPIMKYKEVAIEAGKRSAGSDLHITSGYMMQHFMAYYMNRERENMLTYEDSDFDTRDFYIIKTESFTEENYELHYDFYLEYYDFPVSLVKMKPSHPLILKH